MHILKEDISILPLHGFPELGFPLIFFQRYSQVYPAWPDGIISTPVPESDKNGISSILAISLILPSLRNIMKELPHPSPKVVFSNEFLTRRNENSLNASIHIRLPQFNIEGKLNFSPDYLSIVGYQPEIRLFYSETALWSTVRSLSSRSLIRRAYLRLLNKQAANVAKF